VFKNIKINKSMIEFDHVTKIYQDITALNDICFKIAEGEFTFLVGPSGSGKSTIIKLLIKEEEPTSGKIFFYDADITKLRGAPVSKLRREIGVVFQDFKLLPQKNIFENIAFALEVSGKTKKDIEETVKYVLELIGLYERKEAFPHEISGGEKQKIAIARAIANNPKLLIADEPTGNLDPESSWDIIQLLLKINEWGTTVIMATHGSEIVNSLGKRVIQLDKGKIVSDNKEGNYPQFTVPVSKTKKGEKKLIQKDQKKDTHKKEEKKKPGLIEKKNDKVEEDKKAKQRNNKQNKEEEIQEKEFEITFTTRRKVVSQEKKSLKKKGKDVVDLYKLNLPPQLEEKLIKGEITTIKGLKKSKQLNNLEKLNLTKIEKKTIQTALVNK
jgi:cell division transport system ATP-binding protein